MVRFGVVLGTALFLAVASTTVVAETRYSPDRSGGVDAAGGNSDSNLNGYRSGTFEELANLTAPSLQQIQDQINSNNVSIQDLYDRVSAAQTTADAGVAGASSAMASANSGYSRADAAYSLASAAYSRAGGAQSTASSAYSLASQSKIVATSKWRSYKVQITGAAPASVSCRPPAGTKYLSRIFIDSGYHGRDGWDRYFWLCFYTNA